MFYEQKSGFSKSSETSVKLRYNVIIDNYVLNKNKTLRCLNLKIKMPSNSFTYDYHYVSLYRLSVFKKNLKNKYFFFLWVLRLEYKAACNSNNNN